MLARTKTLAWGIGLALALVAYLIRILFLDSLGNLDRYITYYPAIMVSGLLAGGTGAVGSFLASFLFFQLWMVVGGHGNPLTLNNLLSECVFCVSGTLISVLSAVAKNQRQMVINREQELEVLSRSLAAQVDQKTEELRRINRALGNERDLFEATLGSIGDGVLATDVGGRVTLVNRVGCKILGKNQDEVVGQPLDQVFEIVHEDTHEPLANPLWDALKNKKIVELANHACLRQGSGNLVSIADAASPIVNEEGDVLGGILVFRDVSEKNKLQEHLSRSAKLESLGILAGGLAHDFNNLLTGIFGYIELAKLKTVDPLVVETLNKAFAVNARAKSLTTELLTFAKGGSPIREDFSLNETLGKVVSFLEAGSSHNLVWEALEPPGWVKGDPHQIAQVLENLIINAQQASPPGGTITLTLGRQRCQKEISPFLPCGDYLTLTVKDQGPGVPEALRNKIFDPFFSTKTKGNGLGLSIAHTIMKRHDGLIVLDRSTGGASFTLFFPEVPGTLKLEPVQKVVKKPMGDQAEKILLYDDEEFILDIVQDWSAAQGWNLEVAGKSAQVWEKLEKARESGRPHTLVILDLTVPGDRGGKEMVAEIRKVLPQARLFASSGYSDDPVMADPQGFGFDGKLDKPYGLDQFKAVVEKTVAAD